MQSLKTFFTLWLFNWRINQKWTISIEINEKNLKKNNGKLHEYEYFFKNFN